MKKCFRLFLLITGLVFYVNLYSQERKIYTIKNCQGEMRTFTFQSQIMFFCRWTFGKANFREQKILIFSKGFKVDTLFLHNQLVKLKATLPKNFFGQGNFFGDWYDNQPDEQSIWFTQVYAEKDKLGNFKAFSAFTITFEGTNARDDNQRADPKIKNIEFIFDKERLLLLAGKLKSLSPI